MNKVLINREYGTFHLPEKVVKSLNILGIECDEYGTEIRHHPVAVALVEAMKVYDDEEVSHLEVVEIPGHLYRIEECDGKETLLTPGEDWVSVYDNLSRGTQDMQSCPDTYVDFWEEWFKSTEKDMP